MRVVLRAGFDLYSDFGRDAVELAVHLDKAGVDVLPMPLSLLPGLPREFTRLLEKDPVGTKDVVLTFCPPTMSIPAQQGVKMVMWTRWPVLSPPASWFDGVDLLLVTCPENAVDAPVPAVVQPSGFDDTQWPVSRRDPQAPMVFLSPQDDAVLVRAWEMLMTEYPEFDARLVVGSTVAAYHGADVMVITGNGDNRAAMQFMATGGLVAATDVLEHQNWLHPDMTETLRGDLLQEILDLWRGRAAGGLKGFRSARWIRDVASWDVLVPRLIKTMETL